MTRHPTANASQRARRARAARIDYYPSPEALALIRDRMGDRYPLNVWSGAIDAIVSEWADLAGINKGAKTMPMTSTKVPEFSDANARASDFGLRPGELRRVPCGARRRRDGLPCEALSVPGKRRCKWHGGWSTGPKTEQGKVRAQQNLRRAPPMPGTD